MSWLVKAMSGYLDTQPFPMQGVYVPWAKKEQQMRERRESVRSEALALALKNGHDLGSWSLVNSATCRKCGKAVHLVGVHGTATPKLQGRAITEACNESHDNSYDLPDSRWMPHAEVVGGL